jgi:hypothetical protein
MKPSEIKELIVDSLSADKVTADAMRKLEEAGVRYSFSDGFRDKVLDKIFSATITIKSEVELVRSMNTVFYRIALTGLAAIVIMLISIFLAEGSLSFNSFLGISDSYNESIVCLLTGN